MLINKSNFWIFLFVSFRANAVALGDTLAYTRSCSDLGLESGMVVINHFNNASYDDILAIIAKVYQKESAEYKHLSEVALKVAEKYYPSNDGSVFFYKSSRPMGAHRDVVSGIFEYSSFPITLTVDYMYKAKIAVDAQNQAFDDCQKAKSEFEKVTGISSGHRFRNCNQTLINEPTNFYGLYATNRPKTCPYLNPYSLLIKHEGDIITEPENFPKRKSKICKVGSNKFVSC
jgi:hypothetical protein